MQQIGQIRPKGDATEFTRQAWIAFMAARPEFSRHPERQARNPFTGKPVLIPSPADAADVVVDGRVVGKVYWSMSEEPLVNVTLEAAALPLVREWAAAMNGEFVLESVD